MAVDPAGRKWFVTSAGVSRFDDTGPAGGTRVQQIKDRTWTTYTHADGLVRKDVRAIAFDQARNTRFGTSGGVSKLAP